jgi:hypothetical protein
VSLLLTTLIRIFVAAVLFSEILSASSKISGGELIMISYEGLEKALKEKGIGKTELSRELGLSTRTIAKRKLFVVYRPDFGDNDLRT